MRWTEDKIKEYVESRNLILVGITCLNGKNSIIIVKCKNNHKHFEIKLANLLRRKEEVICNDCKEDIIRNELKIYIESEDYIFIDTFIENGKRYVTVQCKNGHEPYTTRLDHFKNNHRCKKCANEELIIWNDEYIKDFVESCNYTLVNIVISKGLESIIEVKCPNEKHNPYITTLDNFKRASRCRQCYYEDNMRLKWDLESIIKYVEDNDYIFIDIIEGKGYYSKIKIRCSNLKHKSYEIEFRKFLEGTRCSICNISKGEDKILHFLYDNNIDFNPQHRFNNCKFRKTLPFDFYLPTMNIAIEFDGEDHYMPIDRASKGKEWAEEQFQLRKIKDDIKTQYCEDNNIKLIRIPYWEFNNIETILNKKLNLNK